MVSHADCVAACLALMPQNGRVVAAWLVAGHVQGHPGPDGSFTLG